ncbi:MAG: hypothetical protein U9Q06_00195 [Nanoarchaeota archaeon]|nr:hypothetical protein [Nanoarchaeota archaeon]
MSPENLNEQSAYGPLIKLKDLEANQKLMKERLLLIGQNLIESQEKNIIEMTELKKIIYGLETDLSKSKNTILSLSGELSKTARKEELAILERQFQMFSPLKFARIQDVEKIIEKKLDYHKKPHEEKEERGFWSGKL